MCVSVSEQVCEAFFEGLISVFRIDNAFYDAVFVCLHKVDYTLLKLIKTYDATYRQCGGKFVITVMCIDCSFSLSMRIVLCVRENVVCLGAE